MAHAPQDTQACAVVGGGPVGLATAIALAQRGFKRIAVLEQAPTADHYEPTRAFTFVINASGRHALHSIGVRDMDSAGLKFERLTRLSAEPGKGVQAATFPPQGFDAGQTPRIMLMRHELTQHLAQHIQAHLADAIQIVYNCQVDRISLPADLAAKPITLALAPAQPVSALRSAGASSSPGVVLDASQSMTCRLLVGADGAASVVRQALRAQHGDAQWGMRVRRSPAGDVHWKVLQLRPNPDLGSTIGKVEHKTMCVLRGKPLGGRKGIGLAMWPRWQPDSPRPAMVALNGDHPFLQIDTAEGLYCHLEEAFPQVPNWRALVPLETAEQFVQRRATKFWHPQHAPRLVLSQDRRSAAAPGARRTSATAQANARDGPAKPMAEPQRASDLGSAVLLMGDAAHVFPPDLGLGVNAGLVDVALLYEMLCEHSNHMVAALHEYERLRLPEHAALIRIMQNGAPYQYNQDGMALAARLHRANSMLRVSLSKRIPALVSLPAGLATSRKPPPDTNAPRTLMRDHLRNADATTRNFYVAGALLVASGVALACQLAAGMAARRCVAAGAVSGLGVVVVGGLARHVRVV